MQLVVLGLNHKTVSVDIREQFAISEESARSGLRHLDEQEGIEEAVVLSTCNRTEIYAVLKDSSAKKTLEQFFLAKVGGDCKVPAGIYAVPKGEGGIHVEAFIASPDGKKLYRGETDGTVDHAEEAGASIAEKLLDEGGREILEKLSKI